MFTKTVWFAAMHQIGSILSSLVSMGWAMASYHRSIRLAQWNKSNISKTGMLLQFLWHFFITGKNLNGGIQIKTFNPPISHALFKCLP